MGRLALRHVSVWLDDLAPGGAFAHALEWAGRLGVHLRAEAAGTRAEAMQACAAACLRSGVPWDSTPERERGPFAAGPFPRPGELGVFGAALAPPVRERFLRQALRQADAPVLICPRSWQPVSRVLVVYQHGDPGGRFLDGVAEVCRAFRVTPVVLTVAGSEREARLRQRRAEEAFAARGQPADFDFMAGWDVRTAVACVSRWRRCSHVFLERPRGPDWWRRLCGDTLEDLLGVSDALTFLALPGGLPAEGERTGEQSTNRLNA
jgi:hypothetical protein